MGGGEERRGTREGERSENRSEVKGRGSRACFVPDPNDQHRFYKPNQIDLTTRLSLRCQVSNQTPVISTRLSFHQKRTNVKLTPFPSVPRPGFSNAPLTKGMMLFVGASSLGIALLHWKPFLPLILEPHITKHHQVRSLENERLSFARTSRAHHLLLPSSPSFSSGD